MKILIPIFILIFIASIHAQTDLPEIGKISDLKGKTNIYIVADNEARKSIIKALGKKPILTVVNKPADADYFIEYKTIARQSVTSLQLLMETGQMDAYFIRDKKKIVAWSGSNIGGGFKGDTPLAIMKQFLKALKNR